MCVREGYSVELSTSGIYVWAACDLCVCVCVCACAYACVCVCVRARVSVRACMCVRACERACVSVCACKRVCVRTCALVRVCECVRAYTRALTARLRCRPDTGMALWKDQQDSKTPLPANPYLPRSDQPLSPQHAPARYALQDNRLQVVGDCSVTSLPHSHLSANRV